MDMQRLELQQKTMHLISFFIKKAQVLQGFQCTPNFTVGLATGTSTVSLPSFLLTSSLNYTDSRVSSPVIRVSVVIRLE